MGFAGFCDISEDWWDFACGDPNPKFPFPPYNFSLTALVSQTILTLTLIFADHFNPKAKQKGLCFDMAQILRAGGRLFFFLPKFFIHKSGMPTSN